MPDQQLELIEKPLHQNAAELARESVDVYAASLLVQAKTLAFQRGDDEVLSTHVYEAIEIIQSRRNQKRWKDFMVAIGGAFFGAFVSGFITELSVGPNKLLLTVYVTLGILGMLLVFGGLRD